MSITPKYSFNVGGTVIHLLPDGSIALTHHSHCNISGWGPCGVIEKMALPAVIAMLEAFSKTEVSNGNQK